MPKTTLKHEIIVHALTSRLWSILTSSSFTRQFLFSDELISEWTEGSAVRSAVDGSHHGQVTEVKPGMMLRFTLQLDFSPAPVGFQYELEPADRGTRLKLLQEVDSIEKGSLKAVEEHGWLMLQKIKWLAEYS